MKLLRVLFRSSSITDLCADLEAQTLALSEPVQALIEKCLENSYDLEIPDNLINLMLDDRLIIDDPKTKAVIIAQLLPGIKLGFLINSLDISISVGVKVMNSDLWTEHLAHWKQFLTERLSSINDIGERVKIERQLKVIEQVQYAAVLNPKLLIEFINPSDTPSLADCGDFSTLNESQQKLLSRLWGLLPISNTGTTGYWQNSGNCRNLPPTISPEP